MTKCPQCGKGVSFFDRDLFTGVCGDCRRVGARPATLGCGTLILIGIIVAIFSNSASNEVDKRISHLEASIDSMRTQVRQQTEEIRALRTAIEGSRGPGAAKPK